ncbi:glycosyltransferase [uncultured Maribacter sp.]|uniref:glycosyltransferase n=1 Tax=uncultured Maribacter sp. TaxID=431308 RepID=UPI00262EFE68|nr:glycosyltransferase [uncultured Maribacter sp.]
MAFNNFKSRLKQKIWRNIKDFFYEERIKDTTIIQNINYSAALIDQKKAVICYITDSYLLDWEQINVGRTQPKEILSITKVIGELGYSIDIIGCNDTKAVDLIKTKKYDLIFGFGEAFYQLTKINPKAITVWYLTEHHPDFAEKEERKRLDYFEERKNKTARVVRTGNFYKKHHLEKKYSQVITMSEIEPFQTMYPNIKSIFPTGFYNKNFSSNQKNHEEGRKHFLWFGSFGAIHKGLDILLDIFEKRDDIFLHVGGLSEEDRILLYPKKKENIIDYGHININSDVFLDIINKCTFTILPSCSEGFSTSITTCMRHGLIPIVNKDTGFNRVKENAFFLDDFKVDYINNKLTEYSNYKTEKLEEISNNVLKFAQENYTIEAFQENFNTIINSILKE